MKIIKRNGSEATFDIVKIIAAVTKANNVVSEDERLTPMQIRRIAESVENSCLSMNRALSTMWSTSVAGTMRPALRHSRHNGSSIRICARSFRHRAPYPRRYALSRWLSCSAFHFLARASAASLCFGQ